MAVRWYVLSVVCLVYALNIADRYVVSTVLEPIRLDLGLTDSGVALITGTPLAFFYVTVGILLSWLADRSNRRNILAVSLIVWSAFTAVCGLSRTTFQFVAGRVGVGVGEAGGTPPCNAIVADYFPPDRRPMALGVFALGAPIGAWLGADIAGAIANNFGWRGALLALGVPGVLLGLLVYFTIREPLRGGMDAGVIQEKASVLDTLKAVWRQRAAFHVIMASGVCALWGWGLMWWTPTFLMRAYGLNVSEAGAVTGRIHLIGGMIATAATAWWLSRPSMATPKRVVYLLAAGVALATVPSFIAYWTHSLPLAKGMFWIFIPAIYFYIGPCMGLVQNTAPPHMRNMFTAWSLLVGNLFNLVVAPQGVGWLSDHLAGPSGANAESLRTALLVLAPTGFWAACHFLLAARTIVADQERATGHAVREC